MGSSLSFRPPFVRPKTSGNLPLSKGSRRCGAPSDPCRRSYPRRLAAVGGPAPSRASVIFHTSRERSFGRVRRSTRLIDHARKIPSGPTDAFDTEQDLLAWIEVNFKKYGDLYRATVFGKNVYVASSPEYAQHVLRNN